MRRRSGEGFMRHSLLRSQLGELEGLAAHKSSRASLPRTSRDPPWHGAGRAEGWEGEMGINSTLLGVFVPRNRSGGGMQGARGAAPSPRAAAGTEECPVLPFGADWRILGYLPQSPTSRWEKSLGRSHVGTGLNPVSHGGQEQGIPGAGFGVQSSNLSIPPGILVLPWSAAVSGAVQMR